MRKRSCVKLSPRERRAKYKDIIGRRDFDMNNRKITKFYLYGILKSNLYIIISSLIMSRYFFLERENESFRKEFNRLNEFIKFLDGLKIKGNGKKYNILYKYIIKGEEMDIKLYDNGYCGCTLEWKVENPNHKLFETVKKEFGESLTDLLALLCNKKHRKNRWSSIEDFYNEMFSEWWKEC